MIKTEPRFYASDAPVDALVLAGRRRGETDPLSMVDNVAHKALLVAGGKPLIRRVLEALRASGNIAHIKIAAPEDVRDAIANAVAGIPDWSFTEAEGSPASTVLAAVERLDQRALLVTTCDHALLSGAILQQFIGAARSTDAAAGCVARIDYEARFPGSRRTYIRLEDISFSGANLFWFAGGAAKGLADFWRRVESKRKNPAAMAREIGVLTALSYLTGRMTKAALERTIKRKTGVAANLIVLSNAEAAIDVDKPEDLTLVRNILALT